MRKKLALVLSFIVLFNTICSFIVFDGTGYAATTTEAIYEWRKYTVKSYELIFDDSIRLSPLTTSFGTTIYSKTGHTDWYVDANGDIQLGGEEITVSRHQNLSRRIYTFEYEKLYSYDCYVEGRGLSAVVSWYKGVKELSTPKKDQYIETLQSTDPNAYPRNKVEGDYYYEYQGATPVISLQSPTPGSSFTTYNKPQIRFNVYHPDNKNIKTRIIYYEPNGYSEYVFNDETYVSSPRSYTIDIPDNIWNYAPFNSDLKFRIVVYSTKNTNLEFTIKKITSPPEATFITPNYSSFKSNEPPNLEVRVSDLDSNNLTATLQEYDGGWRNVLSNNNLANGEVTNFQIPLDKWKGYTFNDNLRFRVRVYDGINTRYSSELNIRKINSSPSVAILKPIHNQKMFAGYLPFTWQVADIDHDTVHLKIWTDTPNVVNQGVFFDSDIGCNPYTDNTLSRTYLPVGKHDVYFEFYDGYNTVTKKIPIQIEDMVNIQLNDASTFYIPVFDKEKNDLYYRKLNNMLDANKYLFNILELPINQNYISHIQGIQNVTNDSNYTNNGNKIYNINGEFHINKIENWIYSKVSSSSNPIIKVVETGNTVVIKNIEFSDEEKDYTTITPAPRGKDRQFRFEHFPQVYENADSEITNNGAWIKDSKFTSFDGKPIKREGDNITIQISKSGKYIVSAKEKDHIYSSGGIDYSKESNPKQIEIYGHRRPTAKINYTDNGDGTIHLVSKSYDMDFETRTDKGIAEEIWMYRKVAYDDTIVQDWQPISNINSFRPDVLNKTDIKLQVKDYGARLDLINDGELTDTTILTLDKTGKPPIADFAFKVGTTLINSVMADGEIYKGNVGHETLQLDDGYTQWNDFYGTLARITSWTKNQAQLNHQIPSSSQLSTTLEITNKYGLKDAITKSIAVKDINIINSSTTSVIAGKDVNFDINLASGSVMDKWGNFRVTLTAPAIGLNEYPIENTFSNKYEYHVTLPRTLANQLDYTVKVYSKRTGELISRDNATVAIITPLEVTARYTGNFPANDIPASEHFNLVDITTECPINVVNLKMAIYDGNTRKTTYRQLLHPGDVVNKAGDVWEWKDIEHYQVPPSLPDGNYTIQLIATAENGVTAKWVKDITVNTPIDLTGIVPNISSGEINTIKATTSKYANHVTVEILGSLYDMALISEDGGIKTWAVDIDVIETQPEGVYNQPTQPFKYAVFKATIPSGKQEIKNVNFTVLPFIRIEDIIVSPEEVSRGKAVWITVKLNTTADEITVNVPDIFQKTINFNGKDIEFGNRDPHMKYKGNNTYEYMILVPWTKTSPSDGSYIIPFIVKRGATIINSNATVKIKGYVQPETQIFYTH